jgi:hypothetical protein
VLSKSSGTDYATAWVASASLVAVTGRVAAAGTIISGSGFSVNKTSTGTYVITLTTTLAAIPTVVAMSDSPTPGTGSQAGLPSVVSLSTSSFTIEMWQMGSTVGKADRQFSFVVVKTV